MPHANIKKIVKETLKRIDRVYQTEGIQGIAEFFHQSVCIDGKIPNDESIAHIYAICNQHHAGSIVLLKVMRPQIYQELLHSEYITNLVVIIHTRCLALTEVGYVGAMQAPVVDECYTELIGAGADPYKSDCGSA